MDQEAPSPKQYQQILLLIIMNCLFSMQVQRDKEIFFLRSFFYFLIKQQILVCDRVSLLWGFFRFLFYCTCNESLGLTSTLALTSTFHSCTDSAGYHFECRYFRVNSQPCMLQVDFGILFTERFQANENVLVLCLTFISCDYIFIFSVSFSGPHHLKLISLYSSELFFFWDVFVIDRSMRAAQLLATCARKPKVSGSSPNASYVQK